MAEDGIRFVRDCVNPAVAVEKAGDGKIVALHVTGRWTLCPEPPPAVAVDGVRYEPVCA